ncbi:MAG: cation:proton antiporter [Bacteroidales bacterium]
MTTYELICYLITFSTLIALLNSYIKRFQETIVLTAVSVILSFIVIELYNFGIINDDRGIFDTLKNIKFRYFLVNGFLSFMLFAGGISIRLKRLRKKRREVIALSVLGTLLSTFIIGGLLYFVLQWIGAPIEFIYCLLFGALISPTDPISVLAILKKLHAPVDVEIQVEGESLFNDGVGFVVFTSILGIVSQGAGTVGLVDVGFSFLLATFGGIAYGLALAYLVDLGLKYCDSRTLQIMLTVLIPTIGYIFAEKLGISGPIAMVVAGIYIGNYSRMRRFDKKGREYMMEFWDFANVFFNNILFFLIGLVVFKLERVPCGWAFAGVAIIVALLGRLLSVWTVFNSFGFNKYNNKYSIPILTWGGLRGGLAMALALSIPKINVTLFGESVDISQVVLIMTVSVVLFSILVQGSTVERLIKKSKAINMRKKEPNLS